MKTMIRLLSLAALAAAFALPALAQTAPAAPAAQPICEEQARTDMYTDYYNSKKGDAAAQKHAREVAGTYIQKYGTACNDTYSKAVQKFIDVYDKAVGDLAVQSKLANSYQAKQWPEAVSAAKEILAKNPDDVKVAIIGAWSAYQGVVAKNTALSADAQNLAQQALQLMQAGKTADSYLFPTKEEAQDWMEYVIGAAQVTNSNMTAAVPHLVKAAQANTPSKQEPTTYYLLAKAYQDEYQKQFEKYKTYTEVNNESKLLLANINQTVARIIDAYARAVAFSTKPEQQKDKATYLATLTAIYKEQHNGSEAGLNEIVASIKEKPLLMTEPITTLPAETPAATSGDGATGTKPPMTTPPTTTASPMTAQPVQPKPAQPTTSATPKPTPMTKKPPVKRHH